LNCNLSGSRRGQSGDSYAAKLYDNYAGQTANQLLAMQLITMRSMRIRGRGIAQKCVTR